jgi:hypothetical protein
VTLFVLALHDGAEPVFLCELRENQSRASKKVGNRGWLLTLKGVANSGKAEVDERLDAHVIGRVHELEKDLVVELVDEVVVLPSRMISRMRLGYHWL